MATYVLAYKGGHMPVTDAERRVLEDGSSIHHLGNRMGRAR